MRVRPLLVGLALSADLVRRILAARRRLRRLSRLSQTFDATVVRGDSVATYTAADRHHDRGITLLGSTVVVAAATTLVVVAPVFARGVAPDAVYAAALVPAAAS